MFQALVLKILNNSDRYNSRSISTAQYLSAVWGIGISLPRSNHTELAWVQIEGSISLSVK